MEILKRTWRRNPTTAEAAALHVELEPLWVETSASARDDSRTLIVDARKYVAETIASDGSGVFTDADTNLASYLGSYAQLCAHVAQDVARHSPILAALLLRQAIASDYTFAASPDDWEGGLPVWSVEALCFRVMKIADIATDYRPGSHTWIGLHAEDIQRVYSLLSEAWKDRGDVSDAGPLWRHLAGSCRDVDSLLVDEEAGIEDAARMLHGYNQPHSSAPLPDGALSLPVPLRANPHAVGWRTEESADIIRAKLDVANIRACRAARHGMAGNPGAAVRMARRGLEEAFSNSSWNDPEQAPDPLLPLAEIRLTSIFVEARQRLGRAPAIDDFAQAHLERFTLSHTTDWDFTYESAEYQAAWPWEEYWSWLEDRFRRGIQPPIEAGYATKLTDDLVTRTVAFGGLYDNSRRGDVRSTTQSNRPRVPDDELASIQRRIDALHDRLDAPIKSIIEIRENTASLLTIVGAATGERKHAAQRFLRAVTGKGWEDLDERTRNDVFHAELGYRGITAGDVSDEAARQIAAAFGVAFEREERGNPGLVLPDSSEFKELRNRASHSEGRFGVEHLERMRSLLLVVGSRGDPLIRRLANAAGRDRR